MELNNQPQSIESIECNNKNPFVKISILDVEVAEQFLLNPLRSSVHQENVQPDNVCKSKPEPQSTKKGSKNNVPVKDRLLLKRCLICHSLSSSMDKDVENAFELYKTLVQILDFNHGLPNADIISEEFHFCCQICFKAVDQLWKFHRQLQSVRAQMNLILEKIRVAIRLKSTVSLDNRDETYETLNANNLQRVTGTDPAEIEDMEIVFKDEIIFIDSDIDLSPPTYLPEREEEFEMVKVVPRPAYSDGKWQTETTQLTSFSSPQPELIVNSNRAARPFSSRPSKAKANQLIRKVANVEQKNDEQSDKLSPDDPDYSPVVSADESEDEKHSTGNVLDEDNEEEIAKSDRLGKEASRKKYIARGGERKRRTKSNSKLIRTGNSNEKERFSCDICDKTFTFSSSVLTHKRNVHQKVRPHKCTTCGFKFFKRHDLERHEKQHSGEKPLSCPKCGKSFAYKRLLRHHEKMSKSCGKDEEARRLLFERRRALLKKPRELGEKCSKCDKYFLKQSAMEWHFARVHSVSDEEYKASISLKRAGENDKCVCEICGLSLNSNGLSQHNKNVHLRLRPHKCQHCDKEFFKISDLKHHTERKHNQTTSLTTPTINKRIGQFTCHICGRVLKHSSSLANHIKSIHEKIRSHKCTTVNCELSFYRKSDLLNHLKTHTYTNQDMECKSCFKVFKQPKSWNKHTADGMCKAPKRNKKTRKPSNTIIEIPEEETSETETII